MLSPIPTLYFVTSIVNVDLNVRSFNFSPAGWDNEKKIAILHENMHSIKPDQYFTDVIARPIVRQARSTNRELEVSAEDEQSFLLKQQQYLQNSSQPQQGGVGSGPAANSTGNQKATPDPRNSPRVESPKKVLFKK
jgi:dynein light intermediate chain 1